MRAAVTFGVTDTYPVRKLPLLFDPVEKALNPGCRFVTG
jgi:hypothetical protein